jgi:uncharacterized membrane protein YraQ (UPF0718 family)
VDFLWRVLVLAVLIGAVAVYTVRPSAPEEPWGHRLACVVPLSLIAGIVLAWAAHGT